jgi:hypothetical protein
MLIVKFLFLPDARRFIFIYALFNYAVSSSVYIASNDKIVNEYRIGKDVEGSGRFLIKCKIQEFALKGCGKPRKASNSVAGVWAEI